MDPQGVRRLGRGFGRASLALILFSCGGASCVAQRELQITSDPPGAEVRLDERIIGRTPITVPFRHYGKRRITLYLEDHLSHSEVRDISPAWYARFPVDLVTEVLFPVGWKDKRRIHAVLQPGRGGIPAPDLMGVLERAESLRRAGPEGPKPLLLPPQPAQRPSGDEGSLTSGPSRGLP